MTVNAQLMTKMNVIQTKNKIKMNGDVNIQNLEKIYIYIYIYIYMYIHIYINLIERVFNTTSLILLTAC